MYVHLGAKTRNTHKTEEKIDLAVPMTLKGFVQQCQ
jgi:hypothetical protein